MNPAAALARAFDRALPLPPEGPMEDPTNPIWWHHCAVCDAELEPGNEHTRPEDGADVCESCCPVCAPLEVATG